MGLRKVWSTVRNSLWFIPTLWVIASAALAFAMIEVDRTTPDFAARYPLIFGGGADGARGLLSAIAGSMITVAGVTFSITIVALQLASTQFAPRVLRTFMRDQVNQVVLGSFIGAFTYAILVLRSIRGEGLEELDTFVPAVAVSVGILFSLVALGMLVYFLHHIATRIQISTIVASVADEAVDHIESGWPEDPEPPIEPLAQASSGVVRADKSGNLQLLDTERMVEIATRYQIVVRLTVVPGDWVQKDAPLFDVWPASAANDEVARELNAQITVGAQRSIEQDVAFGIRQLVDVAVKAISPGINDPTSATDCIDRLTEILVAAGRRHTPHRSHTDDDGELRLVVLHRRWDDLVALAFDQLRQYGDGNPDILIALANGIRTICLATPPGRHPALHRQARLIADAAASIRVEADRGRVLDEVDAVLRQRPDVPASDREFGSA